MKHFKKDMVLALKTMTHGVVLTIEKLVLLKNIVFY